VGSAVEGQGGEGEVIDIVALRGRTCLYILHFESRNRKILGIMV
jgi:hypothetical protein